MALKKLKWLKYLFVNRVEAETEQEYWNEKRKRHLAHEHSEGVVKGLAVTETSPPSLAVEIAAGRALDTEGNDPEVESPQEIDCAALVPASGEVTVYVTLRYNTVETDPYFVDEIGAYQNKFVQDSYVLEATTQAPAAPEIELARFRLGAGAVLYSGCHPQDCHYITGQRVGARRAERLLKAFEKMGMTPGRFRVEWISAAEGDKYARVINEMQATLDSIPKEKLLEEIERLRPTMEKRARRLREVPQVEEALEYSRQLEIAMVGEEA